MFFSVLLTYVCLLGASNTLEFTKQQFPQIFHNFANSAIYICSELAQDSVLSPQIILKPISSSTMLGTAKQTDLKSSPFRAEYTYKPNLILAHPIHIPEIRDGPSLINCHC